MFFFSQLIFYLIWNEKFNVPSNAIEDTIEILRCSEYSADSKISFIIEKLSIATSKPTARRYSSNLRAFSMMIQKTSPAVYVQLHCENILTTFLPMATAVHVSIG